MRPLATSSLGHLLPVEEDREIQGYAVQGLQDKGSLLPGLCLCDGLGVEVDAYKQARLSGLNVVFRKGGVHVQAALGVAPEADAEDGKIHPVGLYPLPVDLLLMGGDVNAQQRRHAAGVLILHNEG